MILGDVNFLNCKQNIETNWVKILSIGQGSTWSNSLCAVYLFHKVTQPIKL